MRAYDPFFYSASFFLFGALLPQINWSREILILWGVVITLSLLVAALSFQKKSFRNFFITLAILSIFIPTGSIYYKASTKKENIDVPLNKKINFQGVIKERPKQKTRQEFKLELLPPHEGNILVQTTEYPVFTYGDVLSLDGQIKKTTGEYGTYLQNTKSIHGITYYPKLKNRTSRPTIGTKLFQIKEQVLQSFKKTLPYTEAAFLGGITVGEREEFGKEFEEKMSKSGTTHLVALSGYNITIIVKITASTLALFLTRKRALWGTILAIITFVLMTGAESSVVRAAIMGIIAAIAPFAGKIYAPRNSIILAALLMTLWNPNILLHDVGFQLSFLALLGIIYLKPSLDRIFKFKNKGFFAWKENLSTTLSAQLAVIPLLLSVFGSVSATSLISNILILELIPITMFLGFALAGLHLISETLAQITAWTTLIPLKTELLIISLFSHLSIPISITISITTAFIYYALLIIFIWKLTRFKTT